MSALIVYVRAHATEDRPVAPASWDVVVEADRWSSIYPLGRVARRDVFFHCRLATRDPSFPSGSTARGVFVCTGGQQSLDLLSAQIALDALPWTLSWTAITQLRGQAGATAARLRTSWPEERPLNSLGNPVGTRVAHWRRMAGFHAEDAES